MVVKQMQDLATCCGRSYFRKEEELFLTIYTIYLFNKRKLESLSRKQANQINRLWQEYCK